MKTFTYKNPQQIIHWGCSFDSLLELRYALFIQDEYEFMRSAIPIYFDPKTKKPTDYIRGNIRRYTPDFLMRHKESGDAFLIELKPRAFTDHDQLKDRKIIAENYIWWRRWDWQYKVVFDDEFTLTPAQQEQFEICCFLIGKSKREPGTNPWLDSLLPKFFHTRPTGKQMRYIMYGSV